jgi:uncharacterized membrane protein YeaQ/YmgE (transglycosylase-associated protein family)
MPLILLCVGAACTLVGGLTWKNTRGQRTLKTVFLGILGAVVGAGLGSYLGSEVPVGGGDVSAAIWFTLGGSWLGAILLGGIGVVCGRASAGALLRKQPQPDKSWPF